LTSIETVIKDAQAIIANGHASSPDPIVATVKVLAWLFFLKYYEQHKPSHGSPAAIQETIEYNDSLDATIAQINLSRDKHQQLLHLVDTTPLSQKQLSIDLDDEISQFYSNLLELLTPHNKATGVYPTPQPIARFMAKIIDPKPADMQIYDPACGTCSLLVAAHTNIASQSGKEPIESHFFGCENDPNILPLGKMNMALHAIDSAYIQLQDALAQPSSDAKESNLQQLRLINDETDTFTTAFRSVQDVDVILTHPPQGRYARPKSKSKPSLAYHDSWFLQHCMKALKKDGRCAIVVSHGTLTIDQVANNELRKDLFTNFDIQMIVILPPETSSKHAKDNLYLLFFTRGRATCETLYYDLSRQKEPITYENFQPVLDIWDPWKKHLECEAPPPELAKDMRIEPYTEIQHIEKLRAEGEQTKNPYQLYYPPSSQNYSPPAEPKVLVSQILQNTQEIHTIALKLKAQLEEKVLK
jgi:type I restriction-modification system DNA methylase subunit